MKPLKTHYPNATLAILETEPYGSEYPCELAVHWPTCGIEAVVCGYVEADSDGNFDLNTFTYGQSLSDSRMADNDNWHAGDLEELAYRVHKVIEAFKVEV